METQISVGEIYWTNLSQPGGPVRILRVERSDIWRFREERQVAYIEHILDHPYGYSKGTRGYYFCDELRELTQEERITLGL
jgi:hypothetical protein